LSKIPLNKSIEATKLNERTEAPLVGPQVTIPFGALIEPMGASRDREKFRYLGELYSVAEDIFRAATRSDGEELHSSSATAVPVSPEEGEPFIQNARGVKLRFEQLDAGGYTMARAKVRGGWLVAGGTGIAFYPDPTHEWDGTSLE
jgi:hypothetical protein